MGDDAGVKPQEAVYTHVADRGYLNGYTTDQAIARQIAKLTEELGELAEAITPNGKNWYWLHALRIAGHLARTAFDDHNRWDGVTIDYERARAEAADCQVPLFVLAEMMGLDVVEAAVDKSASDIVRGVRNGA